MEFLLPTMQNRKRSTNIAPIPCSSQDNSQDGNEIETQQNAESPNNAVEPPYGELVPPNKKTTLVSLLEKEHKRREERSVARTALRNQILHGASTDTTQNSAMDTFFKSMQLTTKALPERLQLKIQRQIFNIVMEAKEEHLTTLTSTTNSPIYQFRGGSPFLLPINKYAMTDSLRSASSSSNYSVTSPPQSSTQDYQTIYSIRQTHTPPPPQSNAQDSQATYNDEQPYTTPPPQFNSQATYNVQLISPPSQSNAQDNQTTYNVEQPYTSPPPQSSPQDNQARYNIQQTYTPPPPQSNPQAAYNVPLISPPPPPPQSSAVDEEVSNSIRNYIEDFV